MAYCIESVASQTKQSEGLKNKQTNKVKIQSRDFLNLIYILLSNKIGKFQRAYHVFNNLFEPNFAEIEEEEEEEEEETLFDPK